MKPDLPDTIAGAGGPSMSVAAPRTLAAEQSGVLQWFILGGAGLLLGLATVVLVLRR